MNYKQVIDCNSDSLLKCRDRFGVAVIFRNDSYFHAVLENSINKDDSVVAIVNSHNCYDLQTIYDLTKNIARTLIIEIEESLSYIYLADNSTNTLIFFTQSGKSNLQEININNTSYFFIEEFIHPLNIIRKTTLYGIKSPLIINSTSDLDLIHLDTHSLIINVKDKGYYNIYNIRESRIKNFDFIFKTPIELSITNSTIDKFNIDHRAYTKLDQILIHLTNSWIENIKSNITYNYVLFNIDTEYLHLITRLLEKNPEFHINERQQGSFIFDVSNLFYKSYTIYNIIDSPLPINWFEYIDNDNLAQSFINWIYKYHPHLFIDNLALQEYLNITQRYIVQNLI